MGTKKGMGFRLGAFALAGLLASCAKPREAQLVREIESLKGKTQHEVVRLLGSPRVVDSSASPSERIWGYYQMPLRSDENSSPRQRTVLIVLTKRDTVFVVADVRIP
ncbi:MAG TPA: hypothetical protein VNL69_03500 [Bacteroidota bacterium]|nr:hypothetical protein [Bacteroidota bacterium]